jgi:hypothetical protein
VGRNDPPHRTLAFNTRSVHLRSMLPCRRNKYEVESLSDRFPADETYGLNCRKHG